MVISLTSFPARLPHIAPCLESLVTQKSAEDCLVLWLGKEQFPHGMDDIPEIILPFSTRKSGSVDIRFTEDIRSFTKLLPALEAFPDDTIITVDDDVSYAPHTIDILKKAHAQDPTAIFAHAVSDLYRSHGEWRRTSGTHGFLASPQPLRMMLGIGAVLYPPHGFSKLALDRQLFQKLSPTNDDIWFWYCAAKRGTPILRVPHAINRLRMIAATSIGALSATNEAKDDAVNREYIRRICDYDTKFAKHLESVHSRHLLQIVCARICRLLFHYPRQALYCLRLGGFNFLKAEVRRARS
jgi:hypothetical protein